MLNVYSNIILLRASSNMVQTRNNSTRHILLVICCLCALPINSGLPYHVRDYSEDWDNDSGKNLVFCLNQWRALQAEPQLNKFIGLCSTFLENVQRSKDDDSQDVYKRFLFHYSKTQTSKHLKNGLSAIHPLLYLAPKLAERTKQSLIQTSQNNRSE